MASPRILRFPSTVATSRPMALGALLLLSCALTRVVLAQDTLPQPLVQARALLDSGKVEEAIRAADAYTIEHPRDEQGFIALGDAYFKRMPIGRFQAAQAYQRAEWIAPNDPVPFFRYAQVGLWLGGDDGEAMAKDGLEHVLSLDPLYPEAWDDWLTLFRNSGSRRDMRRRLEPFAGDPVVRTRLALLNIEDERYGDADRLLDAALATDSSNTAWLALRAQSAFEAGDTTAGWTFYRRALAHADQDTTDALWHQVIGIARPWEIRAWALVPPAQKGAWLTAFWARRNPDLFAGVNARVAEHFKRLRYARKHYLLMHPLISYYHSSISRAMNLEPSRGEREYNARCEIFQTMPPVHLGIQSSTMTIACGGPCSASMLKLWAATHPNEVPAAVGIPDPGASRAEDRARLNLSPWSLVTDEELARAGPLIQAMVPAGVRQAMFAPLNLDLRSMDSVAARVGYNLATGLDDRGITYLRLGPPDKVTVGGRNTLDPHCASPDMQLWDYRQYGPVRFARPSGFSNGEITVPDMVFRAMNEQQFQTAETALTTDETAEPASLDFGVWFAELGNLADPALTDVVVVTTRGAVAASLVGDLDSGTVAQDLGGVVTLTERPGAYLLLAQARDEGKLGRSTVGLAVRSFDRRHAVSGMLLAPAWSEPNPDRAAMLAHLNRTLSFTSGTTVRTYAEVYGLQADAGVVRYQVAYELLKTSDPLRDLQLAEWPQATRFEFQRMRPVSGTGFEVETLDIVPAQLPAGQYLLRVRVRDLVAGTDVGRGGTSFTVQ